MSRGPFIMPAARWGARLGDASVIDYMNGILHDPFGKFHMGITAENIAERYGITRQMQDELAFESQQRAARAVADGRFASQIVPVELKTSSGTKLFDTDENVRAGITIENGIASCRDRVCTCVNMSGGAVFLQKKYKSTYI